jgi:hypothetical protein
MPLDPSMRVEKRFGIGDALIVLAPTARWSMTNDEYESVDWMDESIPMPSKAECLAKVAELQADYDATRYARDRLYAYPSMEEQMDVLFHQGYDGWKAMIQAVKDKHPKPE